MAGSRGRCASRAAARACSTARSTTRPRSQLPPLEVPPDLTAPARDNRFAMPESRDGHALRLPAGARGAGPARRRGAAVLPQVEAVRFERTGSERWLVVQEPPERIWPIVREFWLERGFLIKTESPEAGVLETDWAENRAKPAAGFHPRLARALRRPGVLDLRARQVPHAPGAHGRRQGHGDLHQPPRHAGGLHDLAEPQRGADRPDLLAAAPLGPRARSRNSCAA